MPPRNQLGAGRNIRSPGWDGKSYSPISMCHSMPPTEILSRSFPAIEAIHVISVHSLSFLYQSGSARLFTRYEQA